MDMHATIEVLLETVFLPWSMPTGYKEDNGNKSRQPDVEAGSNSSTVALRVIGGDDGKVSNLRQ
jgi:hypothetical protein